MMDSREQRNVAGGRIVARASTENCGRLGVFSLLNVRKSRLAKAFGVARAGHTREDRMCAAQVPVSRFCPSFSDVMPVAKLPQEL